MKIIQSMGPMGKIASGSLVDKMLRTSGLFIPGFEGN